MIAFGASITEPEPYLKYADPGIRAAAEPTSEIYAFASVGTLGRSHNLVLDAAAARDDLEALVLVHPHTEIVDTGLAQKVRAALSDPGVAVLGCAGASSVYNLAWWEGSASVGAVRHRYTQHGGGELPGFFWAKPAPAPQEVDVVDGFLLVLSPWAVRNVRFDESLTLGYGVEFDYCLQVLELGRKVMTIDLEVVQHRALEVVSDLDLWTEAHVALARKWASRFDGESADEQEWRRRARRAEAEREAARSIAYSRRLEMDARLLDLERALEQATSGFGWRLTAPLRRANFLRSRLLERATNIFARDASVSGSDP